MALIDGIIYTDADFLPDTLEKVTETVESLLETGKSEKEIVDELKAELRSFKRNRMADEYLEYTLALEFILNDREELKSILQEWNRRSR